MVTLSRKRFVFFFLWGRTWTAPCNTPLFHLFHIFLWPHAPEGKHMFLSGFIRHDFDSIDFPNTFCCTSEAVAAVAFNCSCLSHQIDT